MNKPKKQHYVPKLYLKNFANQKKKNSDDYQIYVLPRSTKKIRTNNINDVAAERDFYTLPTQKNKYIVEDYFAKNIEPITANIINMIKDRCINAVVKDEAKILNFEEKKTFTLCLIMQLLRTKQVREYEEKLYYDSLPKIIEKTNKKYTAIDPEQEKILNSFKFDKTVCKEIITEVNFNEESIKKYFNALIDHNYVFYRINGNGQFVTSDNPIMIMDGITKDVTLFRNGLISVNTIVYFPLTPKVLLCIYHPDFLWGRLEKLDCSVKFISTAKESNFVNMHNKKQFEQCHSCVFAKSKEILERI